jgi:hypothetical protein
MLLLRSWIFFLLLLPFCPLFAILVGNPSQPVLQTQGVLNAPPTWWCFRLAFLEDYVYRQRFKDEFKNFGASHTKTFAKLSTDAALITLNFKNRIDLYGLAGSSQMQLDKEVYTNRQFCWGTGAKLIFLHEGKFRMGLDVKYFETDQKPLFFASEGLAYNVLTNFKLKYHEIQTAVGMSYRSGPICPYIYATYLFTKIEPQPPSALVRIPQVNVLADIFMKSVVGQRRWGLTLGATLIDCKKASLTVESRLFNQNSIDVNGEIRF